MIENNPVKIEEADANELEEKKETIHFPWTIAIIIGVLMVLIIACLIVILILNPGNTVTSSSQISQSSL